MVIQGIDLNCLYYLANFKVKRFNWIYATLVHRCFSLCSVITLLWNWKHFYGSTDVANYIKAFLAELQCPMRKCYSFNLVNKWKHLCFLEDRTRHLDKGKINNGFTEHRHSSETWCPWCSHICGKEKVKNACTLNGLSFSEWFIY